MKHIILVFSFFCVALLFGLPTTSTAQNSQRQTIVDPLTVSGTVGTQLTSSWNNADLHYNSPFSTIAYANMTFNVYGISVPMSVNFQCYKLGTACSHADTLGMILNTSPKPTFSKPYASSGQL